LPPLKQTAGQVRSAAVSRCRKHPAGTRTPQILPFPSPILPRPDSPLENPESGVYFCRAQRGSLFQTVMNALTRCLTSYWSSSIGKKLVVAVTGVILVLFLLGHLIGNLTVFMGPEAFNRYAHFLHHMFHGAGIWAFRVFMLVVIVAHFAATISLTRQNRAARKSYEHPATIQASKASRTMIFSGLGILAFIIYHLLHLTVRFGNEYNTNLRYETTLFGTEGKVHNAYQMVIDAFNWWPATLFYVAGITLLFPHIQHGVGSMFQTLGFRSARSAGLVRQLSIGYSVFIWLGFIIIPLAIQLGFVR
jgi:succinate dehydrogenase / fumarate reductase, cytochrome b subunit